MQWVSLAELGRRLAASTCKTAKHCIKRARRFTSNERIHISEAMQGPLRWLVRQRRYWKKRPLVVSMDWTKVRSFRTLMLATLVRGRPACSNVEARKAKMAIPQLQPLVRRGLGCKRASRLATPLHQLPIFRTREN